MSNDAAETRYPGYDVLNKRDTPSWDPVTRKVLDERLGVSGDPHFFNPLQWATLKALCDCVVAQPSARPAVPLAAMLDARLCSDQGDGWRNARMPPMRSAWSTGLTALDVESHAQQQRTFAEMTSAQQITMTQRMQRGELRDPAWQNMPSELFFSDRVLHDLYGAYYSHPTAWSEIGFGGPANPRGYVRLNKNRRDPWEAIEATADNVATVWKENSRVR